MVKSFKVFLSITLISLSCQCYAMVVEDFGEYAKTAEVISQLTNQYNTLKDQYTTLQQQYNAMTGQYGWGNWQNSMTNLTQDREWAASDWQSALQGMSGGNPERYKELLSQYQQNHPTLDTDTYAKGTDTSLSKSYAGQVQTNQASGTMATYEFNAINQHLQTLQNLGQQMESKQNSDTKSAIDLNSRIQLEVAFISIEELRMQTLLNQQVAELQSANIEQENEASLYNQAGESQ